LIYPVAAWLSIRVIEGRLLSYLKMLTVPAIASTLMAVIVYFSYTTANSEINFLNLLWLGALSLFTYLGIVLLLDKVLNFGLLKRIKHRLGVA